MKNIIQVVLLIIATFFMTGGIVIIIPLSFGNSVFLGLASLLLIYLPGVITKKTYDIVKGTEKTLYLKVTKFLITLALVLGIVFGVLTACNCL